MGKAYKKYYVPPKGGRESWFEIVHYAGQVKYQTVGFLDKNRDSLSHTVEELLANSTNGFVAALFYDGVSPTKKRNSKPSGRRPKGDAPAFKGGPPLGPHVQGQPHQQAGPHSGDDLPAVAAGSG